MTRPAELADLSIHDDAASLRMHRRDVFSLSPAPKPQADAGQAAE